MTLKDFTRLKSFLDEVALFDHGKDGPKMAHIVEQMRQIVSLLEDLPYLTNEEERVSLIRKLEASQRESQTALRELLAEYGTDFEKAQTFFSDPNNFKKTEWEDIQNMQQKIKAAATG